MPNGRALQAMGAHAFCCPWPATRRLSLVAARRATAAGSDLNRAGHATVRPESPQYYDIAGDADSDFVCAGSDAANGPDQLGVFSGTSRSARLARLPDSSRRNRQNRYMSP